MFSSALLFAADGSASGIFNDKAVRDFLLVLVSFAAIVTGCIIITSAKKARTHEVMQTGLHVIVGFLIVAAGAGTFGIVAFGDKVLTALGLK